GAGVRAVDPRRSAPGPGRTPRRHEGVTPLDADDYLAIPDDYARALGGLRWSPEYDAVEFDERGTLTVVEHLEQILEGLFSNAPPVPHFAHVLHLLTWFLHGAGDSE